MTAGETLPFILAGALFVVMALATSVLQRLPLSTSLLYLATGYAVGPAGLGLLDLDPLRSSAVLERITEVAVIVSLFTAGLKLRLPLTTPGERVPLAPPAPGLASGPAPGHPLDGAHRGPGGGQRLVALRSPPGGRRPAGGHPGPHRPGTGVRRAGRRPLRP